MSSFSSQAQFNQARLARQELARSNRDAFQARARHYAMADLLARLASMFTWGSK